MSDLVSRLLAAIEETEQDALAAANGETWVQWGRIADLKSLSAGSGTSWDARPCIETATEAIAEHVQRHHPAAVLRHCKSDREIVDLYRLFRRAGSDDTADALGAALRLRSRAYGISVEEETTGE